MTRRRRDSGKTSGAELQAQQQFIDVLRRIQLASAGVMLVGVVVATFVCAGEFQLPWLVAAGGGVFLAGLALFGLSRPLARWWGRRR